MPDNLFTSSSKRKTFWQLFAAILLICAVLPVSAYLGAVYEEAAGKNKINAWSKQRFEEFYAAPPNTIDMLFIGSSHSYCTFDPENIDAALRTNSYQLGMPFQLPDASYYTLLSALETQHPKTVVMEVYWDILSTDFEMKQAEALFKVLNNEDLQTDYIRHVFPLNERVKYGLKFIRFQQDFFAYENKTLLDFLNERWKLKPTIPQNEGEEYYRSKGYIFCDYIMTDEAYAKIAGKDDIDGRNWRISEAQRIYLEKINTLCDEQGIELIFVTAPISNVSFGNVKHYDSINAQIQALADAWGVDYLDFNLVNETERLFPDAYFRDGAHLNDNGVKAADEYFLNWYTTRKDKGDM